MTLEQLLSHRGGVTGGMTGETWWPRLREPGITPTRGWRLILESVTAREPDVPPEWRDIYSSAGYSIAGAMVEQVAGEPWERMMRERLFEPLNMTSAGSARRENPNHSMSPGATMRQANPSRLARTGAIPRRSDRQAPSIAACWIGRSSPRFTSPPSAGSPDPPRRETFAKLHAPVRAQPRRARLRVGLVARSTSMGRRLALMHSGTNTAWYAIIWIAPEDRDLAVLVACNQGGEIASKRVMKRCGSSSSGPTERFNRVQRRNRSLLDPELLGVLVRILVEILDAVVAAEADRLALVGHGLALGIDVFIAERALLVEDRRLG